VLYFLFLNSIFTVIKRRQKKALLTHLCLKNFVTQGPVLFPINSSNEKVQCEQGLESYKGHRITESQNGRDLCGSSSPTPLPKHGCLQQITQDLVQVGLEYLQRTRLHHLPGQPVPVLRHPQKEVLPHVQTELSILQFVPIAPCPVAGHH